MELTVKNKRLDTQPISRRFTQGEALVDRPRIVLPKTYEGLDISGYSYEIRAVSDKDTMVRAALEKTVEGDDLVLVWTVTAAFTAVSGPLALTIVGMDESGEEIIKITSEKIIIRKDPDGSWIAPPPDLISDAINQMMLVQAAANQAKKDAEAAAGEAADSAWEAAGSSSSAAQSAADADASKVQAEKVLEDTRNIEHAIKLLAQKAQEYADLAQQYADLASKIAFGQKGWFATPYDLKAAYPTGEDGWWAVIGSTDTIWVWDSDRGDWVDSQTGTDLSNYPQWIQLANKLLVPCTCTYNAETHVFSLSRKDVNQLLQDGAELTFRPPVDYTRGDKVEFEGEEIPLEYAGSPVDVQPGAWLADRPAKLIWYADNEQGGEQNVPLRSRRRALA